MSALDTQRQLRDILDRLERLEKPDAILTNIGASVYRTANQSINNAANTAIQFDNEEWDTTGFHDNATNNTRLIAPYAGKYAVHTCVQFAAGAGTIRYIFFQANGVAAGQKGLILGQVAAAGQAIALTSSAIYNLSVGDYIEVYAFQDSGGALNVAATAYAPWFQIHKLP